MPTWEQVQHNPTVYQPHLWSPESRNIHWHKYAEQPHSSQVFCASAFETLKRLPIKDSVVESLLSPLFRCVQAGTSWDIRIEAQDNALLSEYGRVQPTSIDVLLTNDESAICIESKFRSDAKEGFGCCSQPNVQEDGTRRCGGYFGPGSDLMTGTNAWCRLEVWDGGRSPRAYWTLGRAYFRDSVFARQAEGELCPFSRSHFQLMRNFLFAAALAQRERKKCFGVIAIVPKRLASKLERQVSDFRKQVLQPQFAGLIHLIHYEQLIELLCQSNNTEGVDLGRFLQDTITALV